MPTFPNAQLLVLARRVGVLDEPRAPERPPFLDDVLPPLVEHKRLELADGEIEVAPGVRLLTAPGHTRATCAWR